MKKVINLKTLKTEDEINLDEECKDGVVITDKLAELIGAKEGDTIWKIAKTFKSTVDEIARINGIENENKLNIGQQLFIPRYNG